MSTLESGNVNMRRSALGFEGRLYDQLYGVGYTGTSELLVALNRIELDEEMRRKIKIALTMTWRDAANLFEKGGLLSGGGQMWIGNPPNLHIPDQFRAQLDQERAITGTTKDFREYLEKSEQVKDPSSGINLASLGIKGGGHVTFLAPDFRSSLVSYREMNYVLVNGLARSLKYVENSIKNRFHNDYSETGIPAVVTAQSAAEQFILEQTVTFGKGFQKVTRDAQATTWAF